MKVRGERRAAEAVLNGSKVIFPRLLKHQPKLVPARVLKYACIHGAIVTSAGQFPNNTQARE